MSLSKVRVQLLDATTGNVVEEVDVLTSADAVKFADGQTFQQKLDAGTLKGVKGDTGATGAQGPQGPQGPQGVAGADGKTWYVGTSNPATGLGVVGDMHLNSATWDVREKTGASTWTVRGNIRGATGATGPQGIQGPKGDTGNAGATGATGPQGPQGVAGTDGKTWHISTSVPANALGVVGDMHLNSATWDVREKTGASTWTTRGNIRGATGATGPKGDKGDTGDTVKFGTTIATATDVRVFFKKM